MKNTATNTNASGCMAWIKSSESAGCMAWVKQHDSAAQRPSVSLSLENFEALLS